MKWELTELTSAGFGFDDPGDLDRGGVIPLRVHLSLDGERHLFEALFPELYPYFRFEVAAPSLSLDHHQNPFSKVLCLIGRRTENWRVTDSLASMLLQQLPTVISAGRARSVSDISGLEEEQAEPVSEYFSYRDGAMILIDGDWTLPKELTTGSLLIGYHTPTRAKGAFRGSVVEVRSADGKKIFELDERMRKGYANQVIADLVRATEPLMEPSPEKFQRLVRDGRRTAWNGSSPARSILAFAFPEETSWRALGQGWIFVVGERQTKKGNAEFYFARAGRGGRNDLVQRTPELGPLRSKRIGLFGLGCLGAPSAFEFARCGIGEMGVLDWDYVDPGTTVRWPIGLTVAGLSKSEVVARWVSENHPLTKVVGVRHRLGRTDGSDAEALALICDGADLIYDATAEPGVSYFLAETARNDRIPYVGVSATQGGWGGVVVAIPPDGHSGCWYCFRRGQDEGRIPAAPHDSKGSLQPAGCGDPTFTGSSFDLTIVALSAVRTAIDMLLNPGKGGGVLVIRLRDDGGAIAPVTITAHPIDRYEDCPVCGNRSESGSRWKM